VARYSDIEKRGLRELFLRRETGFTPPPISAIRSLLSCAHGAKAPLGSHSSLDEDASTRLVGGFTIVEMMVAMAIITIVSAQVLFSFSGLNEGTALNSSAREMALSLRRAQSMALAVTRIPVLSAVPPAAGVRIATISPQTYLLFGDLAATRDFKYTSSAELIATQTLERGNRISRILDENSVEHDIIHLIFSSPEATLSITDEDGNDIGNLLTIELVAPNGQKKKVVARTTGQISIQ